MVPTNVVADLLLAKAFRLVRVGPMRPSPLSMLGPPPKDKPGRSEAIRRLLNLG